jgi:hypothetical protein
LSGGWCDRFIDDRQAQRFDVRTAHRERSLQTFRSSIGCLVGSLRTDDEFACRVADCFERRCQRWFFQALLSGRRSDPPHGPQSRKRID